MKFSVFSIFSGNAETAIRICYFYKMSKKQKFNKKKPAFYESARLFFIFPQTVPEFASVRVQRKHFFAFFMALSPGR